MSSDYCCEICAKRAMLQWRKTIDNKYICNTCETRLGKNFVDMLARNDIYSKESYIASENYKNMNAQSYGNVFKETNSFKEMKLDFNNGLIKLNDFIFPLSDITGYSFPKFDLEDANINYTKENGISELKKFTVRIWIKDFKKPYMFTFMSDSSRWFSAFEQKKSTKEYRKVNIVDELEAKSNQLEIFKRAFFIAMSAKNNPYIIPALKDLVIKKDPPNFQEALYMFGYSDIRQVTEEELYARYRRLILLMAQFSIIDESVANRINMLYVYVRNNVIKGV